MNRNTTILFYPSDESTQEREGNGDEPERERTGRGQQDAENEVAHYEGTHHVAHALQTSRGDRTILPAKKPEECPVHVFTPTQHEVDQKRHKRSHKQNLVNGSQPGEDVIENEFLNQQEEVFSM